MKILILIILTLSFAAKAQESALEPTIQEINPNELIIEQIECAGNESTSCELIQKEIYLSPGDKINEDEFSNSKIRLKVKNLFSSVNIYLKKGSQRGHVNVVVEVQEVNPFYTETEFGINQFRDYYGDRTSLGLSSGFGHRNLWGLGKIFQAKVTVGDLNTDVNRFYGVDLNYLDPHLFGSKKAYFNFGINHTHWPRTLESLKQDYGKDSSYVYYSIITDQTKLRGTLGYRIFDFSYVSISTNKTYSSSFVQEPSVSEDIRTKSWQSEYHSIDYGWNSEDDSYFATEGSRFNFGFTKYPIQESFYDYYAINFQKNWNVNRKHIYTLGAFQSDTDFTVGVLGKVGQNSNFKYAYQFEPKENLDISRGRWYFGINPSYSSLVGVDASWETGVILEHKKLGILKFSFTNWSMR